MFNDWFMVRSGVSAAGRLPVLARPERQVSVVELALLLACGGAAAFAVGRVKLGLGVPGHSIVLAALPMVLGLALAPRRLAGSVMSAGALGGAWLLASTGASFGSGSFVSLCLLGPMMDVALRNVGSGRRLYAGLVAAGTVTNVLALASRAAFKILGLDLGSRPFDGWWVQAVFTYAASGAVAGLLGALCWFHLNDRRERPPQA